VSEAESIRKAIISRNKNVGAMRRVRSGLSTVIHISKNDDPKAICERVMRWIPKDANISEHVKVSLVDCDGGMSLVIDDTCPYSEISFDHLKPNQYNHSNICS